MELIENKNFPYSNMFYTDISQKLSCILNNPDKFSIEYKSLKPIWKAFLFNDGSMTMFLNNLFNNNLQFNLISSEIYSNNPPEIEIISKLTGYSIQDNIVKRIMNFQTENKMIMEGISYWNADTYKDVFGEDLNAPIGRVMIEKEIEFFRRIKNIYYYEDKYIRISNYTIRGKQGFILVEIIYEEILNNFFR